MRNLLLNLRHKSKQQLERFYRSNKARLLFDNRFVKEYYNNSLKMEIGRNPRDEKKSVPLSKTVINLFHRFVLLVGRFVFRFVYGDKGPSMAPITDLTLLESATSLATKIRTKKITSVSVVQSFIDRIKEVNPLLNCVVDNCYEQALKDAAAADKLVESGQFSEEELAKQKPFLGVPISTKDCIRVKGMLHTSGIWVRRNIRGEEDAEAMRLMRAAGAIPFALSNVSEVCMWWESNNPVHGRSKNPYDSNRIVGGSSGGEGCLLGAAGSPFGLGSDIGGSIRMPAFFNGVFGHKPSKFIVSNEGQYPIPYSEEQRSFLSIGPMSRFATDLKPMLKIIAAENAAKLRLDDLVDFSKLTIYYQEDCGGGHLVSPVDSDITAALNNVVKHFQQTTKAKVQKVKIEKLKKSAPLWFANMKAKGGPGFETQLLNMEGSINCTWELVKWCVGLSHHTLVAIFTAIAERFGVKYGTPKYQHFVEEKRQLTQEFVDLLGENAVFLYPTHPTPAPYHNEALIRAMNFSYTAVINIMGLPACACPLGLGREGLPIGIQVVANWNQDRLCLAVACELERAFGGWVAPEVNA